MDVFFGEPFLYERGFFACLFVFAYLMFVYIRMKTETHSYFVHVKL